MKGTNPSKRYCKDEERVMFERFVTTAVFIILFGVIANSYPVDDSIFRIF